jgi:hypothetical protein
VEAAERFDAYPLLADPTLDNAVYIAAHLALQNDII